MSAPPQASAPPTPLAVERDRAERLLNAVRLVVLLLLGAAAAVYSASLPAVLTRVNVALLVPMLAWTVAQYRLFYSRPMLPEWLALANPIVDVTAVTGILGAYGFAYDPGLALKSPIIAAYFVILAALPVASSTRKAATVSALVLAEYGVLVVAFHLTGRLSTVESPVLASASAAVSPLDEGAKFLLLACAGVVATYATEWQERLTRRHAELARQSRQLQSLLDAARLQSLKLQLQPHFLFNTLNTVTALVYTDPHGAERMIAGLSDLLRLSLGSAGDQEVPLERELETLRSYLEIQQVRFHDRLRVSLEIDDEARMALVPNLLLQPLVENAIRHGIGPRAAGGRITVIARRQESRLALEVLDDGVGEAQPRPREGVGLGNARKRLQSLYGGAFRFEAGGRDGQGFRVYIEVPWHTAPATPASA